MNYKKIVSASYSWLSLKKINFFLLFFCLFFSILVLTPFIFEQFDYEPNTLQIILVVYVVVYFLVFVGLINLLSNLLNKKEDTFFESIKNSFKFINLVFLEVFYIFFWNPNPTKRLLQLLLVILTGLLFVLSSIFFNFFWFFALIIVGSIMSLLLTYNFGRVFFASSVFSKKKGSPKEAIMESWRLTGVNWVSVFAAIIWSFLINFLMFCFATLGLGVFLSVFFKLFFINHIAIDFGFKFGAALALAPILISYHLAIAEVYSQISESSKSSASIKRILSKKVLSKKEVKQVRRTKPKSRVGSKVVAKTKPLVRSESKTLLKPRPKLRISSKK